MLIDENAESTETTKNILVAGVGNPYRSDDGVGIAVLQELKKAQLQNLALPFADLVDAGTDGLALLDLLPKYQQVIIIDAVNMRATPGAVKVFTPQDARLNITHDALSTHGFGLAEMLQLAEQLGVTATTAITIIGVEPKSLEFGAELSAEVKQAIPEIVALIGKRINT